MLFVGLMVLKPGDLVLLYIRLCSVGLLNCTQLPVKNIALTFCQKNVISKHHANYILIEAYMSIVSKILPGGELVTGEPTGCR